MENRIPLAWLPAYEFDNEKQNRYVSLFSDLIATQESFKVRFFRWSENDTYDWSVDANIKQFFGHPKTVEIQLQSHKRFQSKANAAALESVGYKKRGVHPGAWTRTMAGKPSAEMVANHLMTGVMYLVDFKPNMGFIVNAETNQAQRVFDELMSRHHVWSIEPYGEILFLNT
jgi:hypothetical protein